MPLTTFFIMILQLVIFIFFISLVGAISYRFIKDFRTAPKAVSKCLKELFGFRPVRQ